MEYFYSLAVLSLVAFLMHLILRKRKQMDIPGPKGFPWIGIASQLNKTGAQKTFYKWAKQYGDVFKIKIYGEDIVIANSKDAIYEMLVTKADDFAGRAPNYRVGCFFSDSDIVFKDPSPIWKVMKKATMAGLKQAGEKLNELNTITMELLEELALTLTSHKGHTVDIKDDLEAAVSHITFLLIYGTRLSKEQQHKIIHINQLTNAFNSPSANMELDFIPLLRGSWYSKYRYLQWLLKRFDEFYPELLQGTVSRFNGEAECALDALLQERQKALHENSAPVITMGNLDAVSQNLSAAGVSTTLSAVYFLVSLLASDQAFQAEAHAEITEVIGERRPSLKDRFSIPYIESMILELLRLMSHVPFGIPHKTLTDTTLQGCKIPKGVQVWPNLWYLHHDERLWDDPWQFKPRRFLDENGKLVLPDHPLRKQFLAFGAGKRVCAGEALGRNRLFLFAVVLIQRFKFLPADGETINTDPRNMDYGFVLFPKNFSVKIQPRIT